MNYNELMEAFLSKHGFPASELGKEAVALDFGDITVTFLEDAPARRLFLHALVGEAPSFDDGALAKEALKANGSLRESAGAALCQDPQTGKYAAVLTMPLALADLDSLSAAVDRLVALASGWREKLCNLS